MEGHSSFATVPVIPYTLHPILPASSCICISQSDSMVLSGYNFVWWNQSAPPSASHLTSKLGVACWMSGHCCHSALDESQPWKLYLATPGWYLRLFCTRAHSNPSPVACCLAFSSSSPPEPRLHISSKTSPPTVAKSTRHYRIFQTQLGLNSLQKSATAISQCRGPSRGCFRRFCHRIMDRCFFPAHPATHTFFHSLNVLKLGCPILLANCLKENSLCFKLIRALRSAPPKSDESSLS